MCHMNIKISIKRKQLKQVLSLVVPTKLPKKKKVNVHHTLIPLEILPFICKDKLRLDKHNYIDHLFTRGTPAIT